jgi:glutamate dehydrogenase (NADP+)
MTMQEFMAKIEAKNPGEDLFIQAVREVVESVLDAYSSNPRFVKNNILERMIESERNEFFN